MDADVQVKAFLQSLPSGALLADVGCGNGKYFGVRPDVAVLGSDRSPNLAETAARRSQPTPSPLALNALWKLPGKKEAPNVPTERPNCSCRLRPMATAAVPGPLTRCDVAVADGLHLPYRSGASSPPSRST